MQQGLVTLWEASDRVCGKRLKALLPVLLAAQEKHGHMAVDPILKTALLVLSAATIDRLLAPTWSVASARRKPRVEISVLMFARPYIKKCSHSVLNAPSLTHFGNRRRKSWRLRSRYSSMPRTSAMIK